MNLERKCLSLTGSFETSRKPPACFGEATGNFDGAGVSFGVLQWNIGQNTLQPLFRRIHELDPSILSRALEDDYKEFEYYLLRKNPTREQLKYVRSWQRGTTLTRVWDDNLYEIGVSEAGIQAQVEFAEEYFDRARVLFNDLELETERGYALCFDTCVQQGTLKEKGRTVYWDIYKTYETEEDRMRFIARLCSQQANPKWADDVLNRRLCVATGGGTVHGIEYNLEKDFGITLEKCFRNDRKTMGDDRTPLEKMTLMR